jgi:hypothetical protein
MIFFKYLNNAQRNRQITEDCQCKTEIEIHFSIREIEDRILNSIKKIICQRMSFKTATSSYDRSIVKAEIGIPRNSIIKNDKIIQGNIPSKNSENYKVKCEN